MSYIRNVSATQLTVLQAFNDSTKNPQPSIPQKCDGYYPCAEHGDHPTGTDAPDQSHKSVEWWQQHPKGRRPSNMDAAPNGDHSWNTFAKNVAELYDDTVAVTSRALQTDAAKTALKIGVCIAAIGIGMRSGGAKMLRPSFI